MVIFVERHRELLSRSFWRFADSRLYFFNFQSDNLYETSYTDK